MSFPPKTNHKSNQMSDKDKYSLEAAQEAKVTHPEVAPTMLICPISGDFMKEPVITPEGKVYDKKFILTHLSTKKEDPQTRNKLRPKDLKDFSELLTIISEFTRRKALYEEKKNNFIRKVRAIVNQKGELPERPSLFLCPLSNEFIKNPVITPEGKVYDRDSLANYLRKSHDIDETGQALSLNDVEKFDEFDQQLKLFHFRLEKQYQKTVEPKLSSSPFSFLGGIITTLFGNDLSSDDETLEESPTNKKRSK